MLREEEREAPAGVRAAARTITIRSRSSNGGPIKTSFVSAVASTFNGRFMRAAYPIRNACG